MVIMVRQVFVISIALLPLLAAGTPGGHGGPGKTPRCRCLPHEACWPGPEAWTALNATLGGNLVAVEPLGFPCHDPTYSADGCAVATNQTSDSFARALAPGAVQQVNWEAWPAANESCFVLGTDRAVPCGQGSVPLYSAEVEGAAHVQAAVAFARDNNVRLAVKNSGHDYLGRSSAPRSLRIAVHKLDTLEFVDDFVPKASPAAKEQPKPEGPAVRVGTGVYASKLYEEAAARNVTVVVGLSYTVAPAGGYVLGGGHSPLSPWKGMASDNALEFEVVTADVSFS